MTLQTTPSKYHVKVEKTVIKAVDLLAEVTGFSKQQVKAAMQKGAVWVTDKKGTHRVRRQDKKVKQGDELHLYYNQSVLNATTNDAILISDEGEYSAWYKPAGMMSQGSKWGDHCAIDRWVEVHDKKQRPAFIVHRLDRFTSGIILLAHSKKMARVLSAMFQERTVKKKYQARVHGEFPAEAQTYNTPVEEKDAITHSRLISYNSETDQSLLDIDIETGRKHQIRKHLSAAGYPLVGDRLYGAKEENTDLQLIAYQLELTCPVDNRKKLFKLDDKFLF